MTKKIVPSFGDEVKDTVTGFLGIYSSITRKLHGCNQIGIQPQVGKDGKVPESYAFDEPNVVVVTQGKVKIPKSDPQVLEVALGDKAKDPVSGLQGFVVAEVEFINGCKRMAIQAGLDKDGDFRESTWLDAPRLKKMQGKSIAPPESSKELGGPIMRTPPRN